MPDSNTLRRLRERLDDHRKRCDGHKCLTCELGALVFSDAGDTTKELLGKIEARKDVAKEADSNHLNIV